MATAKERYVIALNILAKVGIDGELHNEYAKAMSMLHGLQTYNELNPPPPPQAAMPPDTGQGVPNDPNALNTPPNEGGGTLNMPQ